jgi:ABC-2 type transport system ATP-binding protein
VDPVILTSRLTKWYGKSRGILDVDLEVRQGEVFGFLGQNGAGKTTAIRLLLDLIRPTTGTARMFGMNVRRNGEAVRGRVGYLPGELALYNNLTGRQIVDYLGALRGGADWSYVRQLADRFQCALDRPIHTLSQGNKQKVGLLQALAHRPELVILDEPTNGLDPLMQRAFYDLVDEMRRAGRTILLSSHLMPQVEHTCDRVGMIRDGRLVAVETIDGLKKRFLRQVEIQFSHPVPVERFRNLPGIQDVVADRETIRCTVVGSLDALVKAAAAYEVITVTSQTPSLEEIFLTYYKQGISNAG